ncbi:unnamed protein product [Prorocentrum cordatum]|uniref:Uncharacterized protein n=1 Tax=Prorocentrum cordatum TaxID=2364126 RepID=A0ABN9TEA5_9DINO|nr:unnamed protein product [Polarella glacialis]
MQQNGHCLNAYKTNHLVSWRGAGPFEASGDFARQKRVQGAVCREARTLGPILSFDGISRTELKNRVKGARSAWRSLGAIWRQPRHPKLFLTPFLCFVHSAAIAGLTSFVLPSEFTGKLDSVLVRTLRFLMHGMAKAECEGRVRTMTHSADLRHWGISRTATELRVQRLRWRQQIARAPSERAQGLAAMFGALEIDRLLDRPRLAADGGITEHRDDLEALQFRDDLEALANADPRFDVIWEDRDNLMKIFQDPEAGRQFDKIKVGTVRHLLSPEGALRVARSLHCLDIATFGPFPSHLFGERQSDAENADDGSSIIGEYARTHEMGEGGEGMRRGMPFTTVKALTAHIAHAHHMRNLRSMVISANVVEAAAASLEQRQMQARGGQNKATGREHGSGDATLDSAQVMRQLSGSLWDFFLIPGGLPAAAAAVAAGTTYAGKTKEKGAKALGPPHLHIGVDFFLGVGVNDKAEGGQEVILSDFRLLIDVLGMQGFGDIVRCFKVKKPYSEAGQPERWELYLMFNNLASSPWNDKWGEQTNAIREGNQEVPVKISRAHQIGDLRKAVVETLRAAGAEQIFGAPPPSGLERQLQAALRARQQLMEG